MKIAGIALALALVATPALAADMCAGAPQVLACLHHSARIVGCEQPAPGRALIYFRGGITGRAYQLELAEMRKEGFIRRVVLTDTAPTPHNKNCEQWMPLDGGGWAKGLPPGQ